MAEAENKGLQLLKKGQKGILHGIFSRLGIIVLLFLLQVACLFSIFRWFGQFLPHVLGGTVLFIMIMVIYLLNMQMDAAAKITWLILIMMVPVLGALLLCYTQTEIGHRALKRRIGQLIGDTKDSIPQDDAIMKKLQQEDPGTAALVSYLNRSGCFPVYENTDVTFFPTGEDKFKELLEQLRQAKHFIFLEYFIIDEGLMWGNVLEILAQKASEGVEVRVMYDGMCEFALLSHDYPKKLAALGIKCKMFSPITPFVSTHYNYRDHRKILVIDGHTAFNGGINLADEYINEVHPYGHWKDTALMLKGDAVKSFTLMFLQMWNIDEKNCDFDTFLNVPTIPQKEAVGYIVPYADCPLDNDKVGEDVYIDILNRAERYVHIMTPYLILDGEMENALKFAAKRGVDVKLILPGIPDKKAAYALAKTHYASLLSAGVEIYEYTPGFVHAKVFVSDDCRAVVGTINLDYRSLYHHFECATYLYKTDCIAQIADDYELTLKKCRQVTQDTIKKEKLSTRLTGYFLKAVAPLM